MKIVLFITIIIISSINGFSQDNNSTANKNDDDVYLKISVEEEINPKTRVYYSSSWKSGNIVKKDSSIMTNLSFRYDVKNDRFEMWSYVNPNGIDLITLNGKFFIYSSYQYKKTYERKGYFEIIIDGHAKLLLRRSTKTIPGKVGAYGYSSRQAIIETYYVKVGDKTAVKFDVNKKDIALVLPEKTDNIKGFISKRRINLKKSYDLIKLVNYYNSLFKKV